MKTVDTLIVGGGVSGLGCAHVLQKVNKDFLLVSKNLGGRIHAESAGSDIPYGTAYVCEDYFHMSTFTKKGSSEKRNPKHFFFFDGKNYVHALYWKNIKHLPALFRFKKILKKFREHIVAYRKAMEGKSLKEIFETDEYLNYTWKTPAKNFIKKHGFEKLDEFLINPIVATTTYGESDEINTAYYLGMALPLVVPTWRADFSDTVELMTKDIRDKIQLGTVEAISKQSEGTFEVKTSDETVIAKNIVFAAPHKAIKHLYPNIPEPYQQKDIHVLKVEGTRKPPFDNKPVVFLRSREHNGIYTLFGVKSGIDLVYSKQANPNLNQYYTEYKITKDVYWDPVMNVPDDRLIDNKIEENVYLAGDYNISGLEDAYVSGRSVGRRILREVY